MIRVKNLYGTCDVPELQSYNGVCIPVEDLQSEVNTDSCTVMLGKELMNVSLDD
jgi:hypothetical protein